ncbi:hypothetical protein JCM11251_003463, partial [Rhodosporidiobolus azoricus]
MAPKSTTAE